jgi:ribosomal protein S18 acetylase RimI-like enzyme
LVGPQKKIFFMKVATITTSNLREARAVFMRAWSKVEGVSKQVLEDAWRQGRRPWATANAWNVVCLDDDKNVMGVMLCERQWKKRRLCIKYLAVDPPRQRQGVATALLEAARDYCAREGFTCMWLFCTTNNVKGNALYKRFGFTLKKTCEIEGCEEEELVNLYEIKFV